MPPSDSHRSARWPGLESFREADRSRFFGRDLEVVDLARRVRQRRLTLLFGQSGLGKTSLLHAGLFPTLREAKFLPIYLRPDHSPSAPHPIHQIWKEVASHLKSNISRDQALSEWFHNVDGGLATELIPVLVFDQFEEVFTIGQSTVETRTRSAEYLTQLADLVEARPPATLERAFEDGEVNIEDYNFDLSRFRILISIREDFLSHLERCKGSMPSLMENRQPLDRLSGGKAMEAVLGPGSGIVSAPIAEAIIRFVAGNSEDAFESISVEPPLLSLVCQQLDLVRGDAPITAELLSGKREEILINFYHDCFKGLEPTVRISVEDRLVTEGGFRENISAETLESDIGASAFNTLVERRLLHTEVRNGRSRVELTHDVLTHVVVASRLQRRELSRQKAAHDEEENAFRIRIRRVALIATTLAALVLAGLVVVAFTQARRAQESAAAAEKAREVADDQRKIAESSRAEEIKLREEIERNAATLRESSTTLSNAANSLTDVLIGSQQGHGTLTTNTLVTILPQIEKLQLSAFQTAQRLGGGSSASARQLFEFHRLAAEAYGRDQSRELYSAIDEQIQKAAALVPLLPEDEQTDAQADLEILDGEIRLNRFVILMDKLSDDDYRTIEQPLQRAIQRLSVEATPGSNASINHLWRWAKASNLLARLERHNKKLESARQRYQTTIDRLDSHPDGNDINVLRTKADALNGLGNIDVYTRDYKNAPKYLPDIRRAVSYYEQVLVLRRRIFASFQDDVWIQHELALALENLASARMLLIDADPSVDKAKLIASATEMRKERKDIHFRLHRADPGNKIFATAYAYARSNLVVQEALAPHTDRIKPSPADRLKWLKELTEALAAAPNELKIQQNYQQLLNRYKYTEPEIANAK